MYGIAEDLQGAVSQVPSQLGQAGTFMLLLLAGVTLLAWRAATK